MEEQKLNEDRAAEYPIKDVYSLQELIDIMAYLRSGKGCPWDREQTHYSLKPNLIEEAYETLDAIDSGHPERLCDELGDVLMQVIFHAQIAAEKQQFTIHDVVSGICRKLITRHSHIFGNDQAVDAAAVIETWEKNKRREKGHQTQSQVLSDVPSSLPALQRSYKVQQKAAQVGFDWQDASGPRLKILEELDEAETAQAHLKNNINTVGFEGSADNETSNASDIPLDQGEVDHLRVTDEVGDLIFAVVNYARHLKVQPELALNRTTERFIRRFSDVERIAAGKQLDLQDLTLIELDQLWDQAKIKEKKSGKEKRDE